MRAKTIGKVRSATQTRGQVRRDFFGRWFGLMLGGVLLFGAFVMVPERATSLLIMALAVLLFGLVQDYLPRKLKLLAPVLLGVTVIMIMWAMKDGVI
jgi:hypothetical protein